MADIPADAKHLFEGANFAHVATVNPDGSPQVSPVWIGLEGDKIVFNTAKGRVKPKNIARDPRVAISLFNQENPYESLLVQGRVVETEDDSDLAHINQFTKRYIGQDEYPFLEEGEERIVVRIEPEKVAYTPPAG
jgi:PPOX class probable F420-dependent enzyme